MSTPNLRVLIVDDDMMVAQAHRRVVAGVQGFEVVATAHDAEHALEAIAQLRPDLLLLDIHLPGPTGIDMLRAARRIHFGFDVIVISAAHDAPIVRDALRGGIAAYLTKPFRIEELRTRLREFAQRRARLNTAGELGQSDIDLMTGALAVELRNPSGVNDETARSVEEALSRAGDVGAIAGDVADAVGVSRVTARKYLEWMLEAGRAEVRPEYGRTGRPRRRYRLRDG